MASFLYSHLFALSNLAHICAKNNLTVADIFRPFVAAPTQERGGNSLLIHFLVKELNGAGVIGKVDTFRGDAWLWMKINIITNN